MSLSQVILEFQDTSIPKKIAHAVSQFKSVGSISLADDYPLDTPSSEAYVYYVESVKAQDYVLRISKKKTADRHWYDRFEQFENHNYSNIVKVFLAKEIEDYDVVVMERLGITVQPDSDSSEGLRAVESIIGTATYKLRVKMLEMGIVEYAYDDEAQRDVKVFDPALHQKAINHVVSNIAVGGERKKATEQIAKAIEQYYEETNQVYDDLHMDNVMISREGTYKLIDL